MKRIHLYVEWLVGGFQTNRGYLRAAGTDRRYLKVPVEKNDSIGNGWHYIVFILSTPTCKLAGKPFNYLWNRVPDCIALYNDGYHSLRCICPVPHGRHHPYHDWHAGIIPVSSVWSIKETTALHRFKDGGVSLHKQKNNQSGILQNNHQGTRPSTINNEAQKRQPH